METVKKIKLVLGMEWGWHDMKRRVSNSDYYPMGLNRISSFQRLFRVLPDRLNSISSTRIPSFTAPAPTGSDFYRDTNRLLNF